MSEDDRAVMERLAALEAEVKADAEAKRLRKEAAMAKVREQRAEQQAERDALRERQAALVGKQKPREPEPDDDRDEADHDAAMLGGALALAKKEVKKDLAKAPGKGEKSWVKSALASTLLGPLGWLYAGSLREAVPASAAWLAFAALASKVVPMFLLLPVLVVALGLSGLAGLLYAVQYNRHGSRQRLFGDKGKSKKKLLKGE